MGILIDNLAHIATMDDDGTEIRDGYILIEGPAIHKLGTGLAPTELREVHQCIDGRRGLAIPGMVNTHHHLYQTFQRNVPFVQDAKLFDWLVGLYDIWRELRPEDVYTSAQVGLVELLLSGTTTIADHFYVFPEGQSHELLDQTLYAAAGLGVRFHPSRGSMSRGRSKGGLPPDAVVQDAETILSDSQRFIERYHDARRYSMCRTALAPCSPFSVTDDLLIESAKLARSSGVRLHTHLAETKDEDRFCLETHGCRPLEYMERVGWLGSDVWFAHGVHFNELELRMLASTRTGIAHCPVSNLRLGSGIAPIPLATRLGVPVGLGVDGSASNDSSDMVREVQICTLVHRVGTDVESMSARDALRIATRGGARVLGRDDVGALAPGMAADIAIYDLNDIGLAGAMHDPLAALALTTGIRRAQTVLCNGKIVVSEGRVLGIDIPELKERADRLASKMIERSRDRKRSIIPQPYRHRSHLERP